MDSAKYAALFQREGREHLQRCTQVLLEWEQNPSAAPRVDELFRSMHTIKGMAATMGYLRITDLAHRMETLLAALRDRIVSATPARIDLLVQALDALSAAVDRAPDEAPVDATLDRLLDRATIAGPEGGAALRPVEARRPVESAQAPMLVDDSVRVPRDRLDRMVRLASELLVTQTRVDARAGVIGDVMLEELGATTVRFARSLHDELLDARLVAVRELFERFPRVVRDLGRSLGKDVTLVTTGEEIELDRVVLESLAESLVHLLRNAIDHGIEAPDERERIGKPRAGRIRLDAVLEQDRVSITVTDDGRGVDREKVVARARRDGMTADVEHLDDAALLALISRPGFSTAERVSDLSGRGVGVDAVVTAVRRLGGAVSLTSETGHFTTWTLGVPTRLTVVRALLAQVGAIRVAVPFAMIAETALLPISTSARTATLDVRGTQVPLRDFTHIVGQPPMTWTGRRRPALVLEVNGRRSAIAVDRLLGQQEIVMERFEAPAGMPAFIGGATVLVDGSPALVLAASAIDEGGA